MEVVFKIEGDLVARAIRRARGQIVAEADMLVVRQNGRRAGRQGSGLTAVCKCLIDEVGTLAAGPFGVGDNLLAKTPRQVQAELVLVAFAIEQHLGTEIGAEVDASFQQQARVTIGAVKRGIEARQCGIRWDTRWPDERRSVDEG